MLKEEMPLVDINGVPFVQKSVFNLKKDVGLYLKITQQTKADIEYLCRVNGMSQSKLISTLVEKSVKEVRHES
jgi:hypothetical protein